MSQGSLGERIFFAKCPLTSEPYADGAPQDGIIWLSQATPGARSLYQVADDYWVSCPVGRRPNTEGERP